MFLNNEFKLKTWINPMFKLHDKLVILLRMIGREAKSIKVCIRVIIIIINIIYLKISFID